MRMQCLLLALYFVWIAFVTNGSSFFFAASSLALFLSLCVYAGFSVDGKTAYNMSIFSDVTCYVKVNPHCMYYADSIEHTAHTNSLSLRIYYICA